MFLAEAVKEVVHNEAMIDILVTLIKNRYVVAKPEVAQYARESINKDFEDLEVAFREYQKYSILVSRTKARTVIKLNEGDFSLLDAEKLLMSLKDKLKIFVDFIKSAHDAISGQGGIICLDENRIVERIKTLRADIKTIELSIDKAMWSVEI